MSSMETLRENKTVLTEILSADSSFILQHVEECGLITTREYRMLHSSNKSNWDTIVLLLDKLRDKDENTCKVFLDMLQKTEIVDQYPKLKEVFNQENKPSLSDCSSGPALGLPVPCTDVSDPEASVPGGNEVGVYDMSSIPRGLCLIINNKNFVDDRLKVRHGTDKDASDLAKVFTRLKFTVLMCKDQTAVEMKHVLEVFSELKQLSNLQAHAVKEWVGGEFAELKELPQHGDAFVCCILSHGEKEGVFGKDGMVIRTIDIQSPFNGRNCRMLLEKPKLFFIQACLGSDVQDGVPLNKKPKVQEMDTFMDTDGVPVHTHPIYSDFLVFMSNVEGYLTIRDKTNGTWFIQSLCSQLEKSCRRGQDIYDILIAVKDEVSKKAHEYPVKDTDGNYSYKLFKQSPEVRDTLTKKLIFPAETTPTD
uniref:Uncharacterized protein n=1 Tax=Esox lucius TaxID=8010 RepID=A0AAY5L0M0_ESOLU